MSIQLVIVLAVVAVVLGAREYRKARHARLREQAGIPQRPRTLAVTLVTGVSTDR